MPFFTRPHFEDRQIVQYNDESIQLSGITKIGPTLLDFTGTTTAQTTVTIMGVTGYLNEGREYGLQVQPPLLKISGSTGYTTTDVTGYVLKAVDAFGNVGWDTVSVSANTNTFVTGGTLTPPSAGTNLILDWNTGGSANPINLSSLVFTGNTSGDCITDLYVRRLYGCSPITVHDTITYNGSIIDSATTNSFIFGTNHVLTGSSVTHGVTVDANAILGGSNNRIVPFQVGTYNTIIGGENNTLGIARIQSSAIISSDDSTILSSNGPNAILGGTNNNIDGQNGNVILGGVDNSIKGANSAILGGTNNSILSLRSVALGGTGITGLTSNTTYVPNLTVRENHILHSDSTLEVVDIPGSFESSIKGSYTEFNWGGITTNLLTNSNPSGYTAFLLGNFAPYPTVLNHGFLSYYGTGYTRTGTPQTGVNFYRNKMVLKTAGDSEGTVFSNASSTSWWWENDGFSRMKLTSDGLLGIGLNTNGTESPSANLQIGGTSTTGSFKYIDGNQQSGYVLTCDANGVGSWASGFTQTKEVFFKPTFGPGNRFLKGNYYPYYTDGGTDPVYIQGSIPFDVNTIISSEVLTIPEFTATEPTDLYISYAGVGRVFSATTLSSFPSISYTANEVKSIDVLNFFSGTSTNDVFGFNIFQNNTKLFVLGLKIKYTT